MRIKPVLRVVGVLIVFVGLSMLLTAAIAAIYFEEDLFAHLMAAGATLIVGTALFFASGRPDIRIEVSHREAFASVTFGWVASCLFGALPYFFYAHLPQVINADAAIEADAEPPDCETETGLGREFCSFSNAVFESSSGFTTTGATILEQGLWKSPKGRRGGLPHGLLFWRALTHFLGGMGIIVLGVAILPLLGVGGMQLFKAEVPGPVKDKIAPRVTETARLLWKVYAGLTLAEFLLFMIATDQGPYLAVCHSFATMATGGFSPLAASIEGIRSPTAEWIVLIFMLLAGTNFSLHFLSLRRKRLIYWKDHEFRFYMAVILMATFGLTLILYISHDFGLHDSFRHGLFQSLTIMTTTGFSSSDFAVWGVSAQLILFSLFFIGGCAGSTGGGIKSVRVFLMLKVAFRELRRLIHPHGVIQTKLSGKVVQDNVIHSVAGFAILYLGIFFISVIIFGLFGHDIVTSLTAVGANIGNIGPGLGQIGPSGNYNFFAAPLKWLCIFDMIAGRLEIYSVIIILTPEFWRR
ncbi:MAG: TrkH family potassium uptake protein [Proteobacteria bacterium]|nr:TrkH family potassium uptake protein [Pseudomonadota bacterium]